MQIYFKVNPSSGYPEIVCQYCQLQLNVFFEFKKKVLEQHNRFTNALDKIHTTSLKKKSKSPARVVEPQSSIPNTAVKSPIIQKKTTTDQPKENVPAAASIPIQIKNEKQDDDELEPVYMKNEKNEYASDHSIYEEEIEVNHLHHSNDEIDQVVECKQEAEEDNRDNELETDNEAEDMEFIEEQYLDDDEYNEPEIAHQTEKFYFPYDGNDEDEDIGNSERTIGFGQNTFETEFLKSLEESAGKNETVTGDYNHLVDADDAVESEEQADGEFEMVVEYIDEFAESEHDLILGDEVINLKRPKKTITIDGNQKKSCYKCTYCSMLCKTIREYHEHA